MEFAVQLLQLVHGRRDAELQEPNTLRALEALAERGYIAEGDAEALSESYRFLRKIEHRLQLAREVQTHELPSDGASRTRLARSMGLRGEEELADAYARHTDVVRGLHERLFYRPLLESFAGRRAPRPGQDRAAAEELLEALGFGDPRAAAARFEGLVSGEGRIARVLEHLFPVVAPALALAADPDAAVLRFERVAEDLPDRAADALAADPRSAVRLARLIATSSWATDALTAEPERGVRLAEGDPGERPIDRLLDVAARYAAGELEVPESGMSLPVWPIGSWRRPSREAEAPMPLAVIGLGKLGAEELNFASDLDVMFVYEGEGPRAFDEAQRAGERILDGIRRRGFEADADLRPEGKSGPLARSVAAYLEYWESWAHTWEFQALVKARFVAGDELLGKRFTLAAEDFAYRESLPLEARR